MYNIKDDRVRRAYQAVITELYDETKMCGCTSGTDVEMAGKEFKDGIVGTATKVFRTTRRRRQP